MRYESLFHHLSPIVCNVFKVVSVCSLFLFFVKFSYSCGVEFYLPNSTTLCLVWGEERRSRCCSWNPLAGRALVASPILLAEKRGNNRAIECSFARIAWLIFHPSSAAAEKKSSHRTLIFIFPFFPSDRSSSSDIWPKNRAGDGEAGGWK